MILCAATGNAGKLKELRRILEMQGYQVKSQKELGIALEPDETGESFEENAVIKAKAICAVSGLPTIADDSGLCVDALDGRPGVHSARYCGRHGDDEANNDKLLREMEEIPDERRGARFVSVICICKPDGSFRTYRGECRGRIAHERLAGDYGFGYDPLFVPERIGQGEQTLANDEGKSYAQILPTQKDAISHRGAALRQMQQDASLADFLCL